MKIRKIHMALLLLTALAAPCLGAATWTWELPPDRYKQLNLFERAQYDKAVRLFKENNPKGAASEFEKFAAQFADSPLLPHVVFMRAYSLHQSKHRMTAIRVYNDVLDYFGDVVEDAAPALYFMGLAHIENGDVRKGLQVFKEMVEDKDYSQHPLAAGALRHLGNNHFRNKEYDLAVRYWKRAAAFGDTNRDEAAAARNSLTDYYIKSATYADYEEWLVNDENRENASHRRWVFENAWDRAWHGFAGRWDKYDDVHPEEKAKDIKSFWEYFKTSRPWYEKVNDPWRFFDRSLHFLIRYGADKEERKRLIDEAFAFVKSIEDKGDADNKLAWMADRLRDAKQFDQAEYCLDQMRNRPHAEYKKYEIFASQHDWKKAEEKLKDVEGMGNADWKSRAERERARIYKDHMGKYAEAITLYQQINDPPGTLWAVQECYRKWGRFKDAIAQLTEIENSFPDQAAEAAWHKARYYHEAGDGTNAIAQARRILKVYPKSQASSRAHQLLESYGIATGGGVAEGEE